MYEKNFLKYLNKKCKKIYLSTGMSNLNEIKKSLSCLTNPEVVIMHCVSEYPLAFKNANLLAIKVLKKKFPNYEIGYSDHSIGIMACQVAVSLGATVIEKHFTLNKRFKGTDHILSADPKELNLLSNNIRNILDLLGKEIKKPSQKEIKIKSFMKHRFIV